VIKLLYLHLFLAFIFEGYLIVSLTSACISYLCSALYGMLLIHIFIHSFISLLIFEQKL